MQRIRGICANYGQFVGRMGLIAALITWAAACESADKSEAVVESPANAAAPKPVRCASDGFLETQLFGGLELELSWAANDLVCEGMPRPEGDGARLRFAGQAEDGREIAFIIALPDLRRGATGTELPSTVTVIEVGAGRFFSSADVDVCWTDITSLDHIVATDAEFAVSGNLYCVAPLAQVNGDSDVVIRELRFRGQLDWNAS